MPIGEVDSIMYKSPFLSSGIIPFVAASTNEISGSWLPLNGVGTTMRYTSAELALVDALKKPLETAFETMASKSGSTIWIFPWLIVSTTLWFISTPKTFVPCDAIKAEVGNPI